MKGQQRLRMTKQSRARRLAKKALPKRLLARRRREQAWNLALKGAPLKHLKRLRRAQQRAAAAAQNAFVERYRQVTGVE